MIEYEYKRHLILIIDRNHCELKLAIIIEFLILVQLIMMKTYVYIRPEKRDAANLFNYGVRIY